MRVRRIRLRDFRGVEACDVDLLAPGESTGVVIVEGPNEIGKTSLAEALDLIWTHRDTSRARVVRGLQPVGRDVGTQVEVTVEGAGVAFTYAKTWNRDTATRLLVTAPRREQLTGREAHERAEQLLAEMVDPGLWQALRVPQGDVALPDVASVPAIAAALARASGAGVVDARDGAVADLVHRRRAHWWTEQGRPREPLRRAACELEAAQAEQSDAQAALERVRDDLAAVDRLTEQIVVTRDELEEARAAQAGAREAAERARCRREAARHLADARRRAEEAAATAADALARRTALVAEHAQALADLADVRDTLAVLPDVASASASVDRARADREAARARRDDARLHARRAARAAEQRQAQREHDVLRQRVAEARRAARAVRTLEDAASATPLGDADLARLRELEVAARAAERAADAAAAHLTVRPSPGVAPRVTAGARTIGPDGWHDVSVVEAVDVRIEGVVDLRVEPGADAVVAAADRARRDLDEALAAVGHEDLAGVEAARERARALHLDLRSARAVLDRVLDGDDLDDLAARLAAHDARRWSADGPGGGAATHEAARPRSGDPAAAQDAAERDAADAQAALDAAHERLDAAVAEVERRRSRVDEHRAALERADATLQGADARLRAARAAVSDDGLRARARSAEEELSRAVAAALAADAQLDDRALDAQVLAEAADAAVERVARDLTELERELAVRSAQAAARSEEGPATRADRAAARLHAATGAHERAVADADAAALLHATFTAHRAQRRRRWVAPLADEIHRLGGVLWGDGLHVDLDDELRVARRTLRGVTLDYDDLSHGAREQLALLSRLACAIVVGPGGAPVVIDDALGFSDPERLRRMGAVLGVAGRSCQVVLLTCHPQRYRHVPGARTVRLPTGPSDEVAA